MNDDKITRKELTPFEFMSGERDEPTDVLDLDKEPITHEEFEEQESSDPEEGDYEVEHISEGEDPDSGSEVEFEVKGNVSKYFASLLKEQGALPEDFEVTDDITEDQLNENYLKYKEEPLKNQIRQEVLQELAEVEGLTPELIQEIKTKYYGVQDVEIQTHRALETLATYAFDEVSETFESDARAFLTDYHTYKGYSPSRVERMVENDLNDEGVSTILQEYQKDLKIEANKLGATINQRVADAEQKKIADRQRQIEMTKTFLDKGEVAGVKFSPEELSTVKKALYERTETVKDTDGKLYKVSLYYKKLMEARNNPEVDLLNKINFILGTDLKKIQNEATKKASQKLSANLHKFVQVNVKDGNRQTPIKKDTRNDGIERIEIVR